MSDRRSRAYAARNHHSYVGGDAPASGLTGPDSPITRLGKRVQVIGDCWVVNGKLDAVFFGGLDETDEMKRYTVVDWKTGVKPRKPDEIKEKLAQLDLYRLLLAAMEGVPLDAIDACLYYVSEPHEADRELDALDKTEEEILAELSYGIPQQSDND